MVYDNVLEAMGHTPMIRLQKMGISVKYNKNALLWASLHVTSR